MNRKLLAALAVMILTLSGCGGSSTSTRSYADNPAGSAGSEVGLAGSPAAGGSSTGGRGSSPATGGTTPGGQAGETSGGEAGSDEPGGSAGETSGGEPGSSGSAGEPALGGQAGSNPVGGTGGTAGDAGSGPSGGSGGVSGSGGSAGTGGDSGSGGTPTGGSGGDPSGGAPSGGSAGMGGTPSGGSAGESGSGGTGGTPPVCPVGDTQCNGDGNVETCNGLGWVETEVCPYVCSGGVCVGVCTPGTKQCSGDYVETCNLSGQWQPAASACPYVCQAGTCAGTCVPGTVECVGQDATRTCNAGGQWDSAVGCPVPANSYSTCSGGICGSACNADYEDCGGTSDGCETVLGTLNDCLGCGDTCDGAPANADNLCEPGGCAWECQATWGNCDGDQSNGCEQDVWNDPLHCGVCEHSCWDGACSAGVCEYDIEEVFESTNPLSYQGSFATYGPNVYWIDSVNNGDGTYTNTIYTATDADPTPVMLAGPMSTDPLLARTLVTNGTDLVWLTQSGTYMSLHTIPVGGGAATTIVTNKSVPLSNNGSGDYLKFIHVDVDDTHVYWVEAQDDCYCTAGQNPCPCATGQSSELWRVPLTGGSPELLRTFWNAPLTDIFVDGTHVHVSSWGRWYDGNLYPYGGTISYLKTGDFVTDGFSSGYRLDKPEQLVADGNYMFWVNDYGNLFRATLGDNSSTANTDLSPGNRFHDVEINGSLLYLRDGVNILSIGINGGPLTTVAAASAYELAVSDSYVYWRQAGPTGGMVLLRAPK